MCCTPGTQVDPTAKQLQKAVSIIPNEIMQAKTFENPSLQKNRCARGSRKEALQRKGLPVGVGGGLHGFLDRMSPGKLMVPH